MKLNEINNVYTLGTMYDNNCIVVEGDGKEYRMNVKEIISLLEGKEFDVEEKKKYSYLRLKKKELSQMPDYSI